MCHFSISSRAFLSCAWSVLTYPSWGDAATDRPGRPFARPALIAQLASDPDPVSRSGAGLVVDRGGAGALLDRGDRVHRRRLLLVRLAGRHHLAVRGHEVEAELAVAGLLD